MKWIQRDRRQKTGLQLEPSPPISSVPSISPPFQPVLALSISLWLHTVSDEERLEMLSNREDSSFLLTQRPSPSVTCPSWNYSHPQTSLQLCPACKWSSSLKNLIVSGAQYVPSPGPCARLLTWQAPLPPFALAFPFFVTSVAEIRDSFCCPDLLSDILPESRRLRAQISWCVFQS